MIGTPQRSSALAGYRQATPKVDRFIRDFAELTDVERVVTRYAYFASPGFDVLLTGALLYVDAWGITFTDVTSAQEAPSEMARAYEQWMTLELHVDFSDPQPARARQLGDESWGWVAVAADATDGDTDYPWSLFAVRRDSTLQILVGLTASGSPLSQLADISEGFIDRWPNEDTEDSNIDVPVGGIWDTLPQLQDLQEGMVIDYSRDATDGFT